LAGKINPFTVLDIGGQQIGVIGLVTPDAPNISSPGAELSFNDDLVGVTQAAVDGEWRYHRSRRVR
jgi:5'-nucleotidase